MKDIKQNYDWADAAKGIGIILVVLGHAIEYCKSAGGYLSSGWQVIYECLGAFHMPLFFFISAFLQRRKEQYQPHCYENKQLLVRISGLLIPYVVFSFVFWLSKVLMSASVNNAVTITDLLLIIVYPLSTLWFLYALIVFTLLRALVYRTKISSITVFGVCVFASILFSHTQMPDILAPTVILRVIKNSPFFAAGILAAENGRLETVLSKKKFGFCIAPIVFCILKVLNAHLSINYSTVNMILGFMGIWFVLCVSDSVSFKIINKLGKDSLGIYLMHDYVICVVVIILRKFITEFDSVVILALILGTAIPYFIYQICMNNKYLMLIFKPQILIAKKME